MGCGCFPNTSHKFHVLICDSAGADELKTSEYGSKFLKNLFQLSRIFKGVFYSIFLFFYHFMFVFLHKNVSILHIIKQEMRHENVFPCGHQSSTISQMGKEIQIYML